MTTGIAVAVAVAAGFVLAIPMPWLHRKGWSITGWWVALVPLGIAAYVLSFLPTVRAGIDASVTYPWVPGLDVHLAFYIDGLSLFFALLVTVVGSLVFVYTGGYMKEHDHAGRFYSFLLLFMASMLGLVLADNLVTLYVFFELTSLSSFLLIGFDPKEQGAGRAARQALVITGAGGLALLGALLLLGEIAGTYEISTLLERGALVRDHPLYLPLLLLVLGAAFTKSAQFPFYPWLPNAMKAPTPVSAYLHSAAMVKAGIYVLARFSPVLSGTESWTVLVTGFGALTMVACAWVALRQTDLKIILAYSTIMALGLLTMLLGLGGKEAVKACLLFVLVHAGYKATLFMTAGAIDHETGVRDVTELGGLRRAMPATFVAALLAGLSMAGLPPFIGFIGKEAAYAAALHHAPLPALLTSAAVLANIALVTAAGVVALRPFTGSKTSRNEHSHAAPAGLWCAPLVLGVLGLLFGLVPSLLDQSLLGPAVSSVLGEAVEVDVKLWHGITAELGLSVVTIASGVGLYLIWSYLHRSTPLRAFASVLGRRGPDRAYSLALGGLTRIARPLMAGLQSGKLRHYMAIVLSASVFLVGLVLVGKATVSWPGRLDEVRFYEWLLAGFVVLGAMAAIVLSEHLASVLALSVTSYSIALIYLIFGAPDVALAQFLVETLTAILVVVAFVDLPRRSWDEPLPGRLRDAGIALGVGALVTGLILAALNVPFSPKLTDYFAEHSYTEAHGRNIVNVILVDFRALDTLGEVTVLLTAGLGVYALIREAHRRRSRPERPRREPDAWRQPP